MRIIVDDLRHPAVAALLEAHLADMRAISPPGSVHALDLDKLRAPEITFLTAWQGDTLIGCGAIKALGDAHGEIKSMRTAAGHIGKGVGAAILTELLRIARERRYARVSLETGRPAPFAAAHRLYARFGFSDCPPFGNYSDDPFSKCMTLALP